MKHCNWHHQIYSYCLKSVDYSYIKNILYMYCKLFIYKYLKPLRAKADWLHHYVMLWIMQFFMRSPTVIHGYLKISSNNMLPVHIVLHYSSSFSSSCTVGYRFLFFEVVEAFLWLEKSPLGWPLLVNITKIYITSGCKSLLFWLAELEPGQALVSMHFFHNQTISVVYTYNPLYSDTLKFHCVLFCAQIKDLGKCFKIMHTQGF